MVHNRVAMAETTELSYTEDEIKSFLPSGWNLTGGEGTWNPKKRVWTARILDDVDFDWPVTVQAKDAAEHGRLEALKRAMDETWRGRLGKRTRGLGL